MDGVFQPPRSKAGAFSKANWGDYNTQSRRGPATIKRASVFLKTIKNLKEKQWDDIVQAAWDIYNRSKARAGPGPSEVGAIDDAAESSGDELLDPLYE